MSHFTKEDLLSMKPRFDTFVGVDSDGCVFDTMTVKQCGHFHPLIIKLWELESVAVQLRDVAEFINLKSTFRGRNRFPALLMTFEMLPLRPGVAESGVKLPPTDDLRAYCNSGLPFGNTTLADEVARTGSAELAKVLEWSLAVNEDIERNMPPVTPFPSAIEGLKKISGASDMIVVSQTPEETLIREWSHHGIETLPRVIAGQELGRKAEQLKLASDGRYAKDRILLIGDAPGDLEAAREAGVCFYPIQPGEEEKSWTRFNDEIYDLFRAGRYRGLFENCFIERFVKSLPSKMDA